MFWIGYKCGGDLVMVACHQSHLLVYFGAAMAFFSDQCMITIDVSMLQLGSCGDTPS